MKDNGPIMTDKSEAKCAQCEPWNDGYCDFGCPCDDCKPRPWTPEQIRAFYAGLVPHPPCGDDECNGWLVDHRGKRHACGPCADGDAEAQRQHEIDHSAARLG